MAQFVRNLAEKAPALVNAAVTYSKPRLATFWHYAKVELVPPTPAEIPTAIQSLKKIVHSAQTGSFKQLTVKSPSAARSQTVSPSESKRTRITKTRVIEFHEDEI
ncbi:ATP synthase subunit g, mitochondrial isoform X1 [Oryctolagus cuniculus]|uniref:ATP synthase subunit g, mitochondrial isoform X1 n=1 Tax=Oryctolagus cuniculus TaxID=9986 RepID=UPI00387A3EEB